jgi:hypothetical protein
MTRPPLEVADIVRQYGAASLARYGHVTSTAQPRVLRAITLCRTAALGGHTTACDHCGHLERSSNSCRNRHCPKCQGSAQAAWLADRQQEVLNVPYFHVVFTLPDTLDALALQNPRLLSSLLLHTVAETLLTIAQDPTHLGAHMGFLAILHTWGQQLPYHPHLHCVVPGGGLSPDGTSWVPCAPNFFLPVRVLRRCFRRRFLAGLTQAWATQALTWTGPCQALAHPQAWQRWMQRLREHDWVVYAQRPMREPAHVLKYLARYTHRVAISHRRLLALEEGRVTFRWRDYAHGNRHRTVTLDAVECIRRFLLHGLPRGLQHIRHYGFLANRVRQEQLTRCRQLLSPSAASLLVVAPVTGDAEAAATALPRAEVCPVCQTGRMQLVQTVYRWAAAWNLSVPVPGCDTS